MIALREQLGLSALAFPEQCKDRSLHLDQGRHVKLKPDVSWWVGQRCVFVGDVKYKRLESAGRQNADLYQMLAYTIAAKLPAGMLLYAAGEQESKVHVLPEVDKRIRIVTLDLACAPSELLAQVAAVATQVRAQRALAGR